MRCVACGKGTMVAAVVEETVQVGGLRFKAQVPGKVCSACGESYLSSETVGSLERSVAESLARAGKGTPEAFRYMRKVIGLKAVEVAELFGVTPETISRWEHGERQPEPRAVKLLGALVVEYLAGRAYLLEYLRAVTRERAEEPNERGLTVPIQLRLQPA